MTEIIKYLLLKQPTEYFRLVIDETSHIVGGNKMMY